MAGMLCGYCSCHALPLAKRICRRKEQATSCQKEDDMSHVLPAVLHIEAFMNCCCQRLVMVSPALSSASTHMNIDRADHDWAYQTGSVWPHCFLELSLVCCGQMESWGGVGGGGAGSQCCLTLDVCGLWQFNRRIARGADLTVADFCAI